MCNNCFLRIKHEKYNLLVHVYGGIIADLLNSFMKKTRLEAWDGPEPPKATRKTGEIILENWMFESLEGKSNG